MSGGDELRPTEGARFLLERTRDDGASAQYRAVIYTPDASHEGTATLHDDGSVEHALPAGAGELADMLAMIAKLTARGASKRRDDGLPAWPARVLRWRGPGR